MLVMEHTESVKAKGEIRELQLKRETLRELDAGEFMQAQAGGASFYCFTDFHCTRACPNTKKC